uniref:Prepilin-type N-terminal cleavage/methylation domain-containing protein n=1 Tax=Dictyoglomus thermophilum TaxID=14 RepID=A0A7C3RJX8_DICTH
MKKGFSFLEVIVVISILGILLWITYNSILSKPDSKILLQNTTNQFIQDIRYIRQRAIINKTDWILIISPQAYTSYTFLDDKGKIVTRFFNNISVNTTATLFSFDRDGNFTADYTETYAILTLIIDNYTSTIRINSLGFIEVEGL